MFPDAFEFQCAGMHRNLIRLNFSPKGSLLEDGEQKRLAEVTYSAS